jgi:putative FmdB family regulatory protein
MPTYEYKCEKCNRKFSLALSISAHDKEKVTCPKCKSGKVRQQVTGFITKTSRKS